MKSVYIKTMRGTRSVLDRFGVLAPMDSWAQRSKRGAWARSLLSIYDLDDLAALDVPWWTFSATDKVAQHLAAIAEPVVFEWGSGASTLWLAQRAFRVTSIEHDPDWADRVRSIALANVEIISAPPTKAREPVIASHKRGFEGLDFSQYVAAIDDLPGKFDVIVVDGRAREACLVRAIPRLATGGVIVFDNVDRQRYRGAIAAQAEQISSEIYRGLTPCLPYPTRTALVRRRPS